MTITTTANPIHIPFPFEGAAVGGASGALSTAMITHQAAESGPVYNNLSGSPV